MEDPRQSLRLDYISEYIRKCSYDPVAVTWLSDQ